MRHTTAIRRLKLIHSHTRRPKRRTTVLKIIHHHHTSVNRRTANSTTTKGNTVLSRHLKPTRPIPLSRHTRRIILNQRLMNSPTANSTTRNNRLLRNRHNHAPLTSSTHNNIRRLLTNFKNANRFRAVRGILCGGHRVQTPTRIPRNVIQFKRFITPKNAPNQTYTRKPPRTIRPISRQPLR